jgi:hypothetical protein
MNPTTGCRLTEGNLGTEERCAPQLAGESEDQIVGVAKKMQRLTVSMADDITVGDLLADH